MTAPAQKIRMKFRCDQDVEQMLNGADGTPFCNLCQRSLVDFRTKTLAEVVAYTNENKSCGIFKTEHVESDYVFELPLSSFRKYFLAFTTFLFAETVLANPIKDSLKIEDTMSNKSNISSEIQSVQNENASVYKESKTRHVRRPKFTRKSKSYKYGVFFSTRFPFVRFRYFIYHGTLGFW